ncbi:MAG: hypothetical protein R3B91_17590 [Planctomycetaceae bacterium]
MTNRRGRLKPSNHCGPVSYLDELAMSPDGRYILFCSSKEIRELLKKQPD